MTGTYRHVRKEGMNKSPTSMSATKVLTYHVTIEQKKRDHPWYGQGSPLCYALNGRQGETLVLTRGFKYTFLINTPGHPFYISTSATGAGDGDITGGKAIDKGELTLLITSELPETLYYQCAIHAKMGGPIQLVPHHSIHLLPFMSNLYAPIAIAQIPFSVISSTTERTNRTQDTYLYIADQIGIIYLTSNTSSSLKIALDLRKKIVPLNPEYEERGLLDIVLPPRNTLSQSTISQDIHTERYPIYISYSARISTSDERTGLPYETRISRFQCLPDGMIDIDTEEILLAIGPKNWPHHEGGRIAFGPDKMLYITVGDGGPQKDPENRAQNLSLLYGKILRIDPSGRDRSCDVNAGNVSATDPSNVSTSRRSRCISGKPYLIPNDNPFVSIRNARPEIWAYGFRNPWSISFDDAGRCFVGDVGLDEREEVDLVLKGGNYGWNAFEGTRITNYSSLPRGTIDIKPIWEYTHTWLLANSKNKDAVAIIGGYYMQGYGYIFADYAGVVMRIDYDEINREWKILEHITIPEYVRALGKDTTGRVYLMTTKGGGVKKGQGAIYEILF